MKTHTHIIIVFFVLTISLSPVLAFGVAPAEKILSFEAGLEETYTGLIVNTEGQELTVTFSEEDPYNILEIQNSSLSLLATESQKEYTYTIRLPETLPEEAFTREYVAKITVQEQSDVSGVSAVLRIGVPIKLRASVAKNEEASPENSSTDVSEEDQSFFKNLFSFSDNINTNHGDTGENGSSRIKLLLFAGFAFLFFLLFFFATFYWRKT